MKHINMENKTVLITGAAGFIGADLVRRLLQELSGSFLIGIDNLNSYYDISLKEYRLQQIAEEAEKQKAQRKNRFLLKQIDISDKQAVGKGLRI